MTVSPSNVPESKKITGNENSTRKNSKEFVIGRFKNRNISICKPLIPLKFTLFLYYGAGSFTSSFIVVLYKQRGVSLSNLSTMTMLSPIIQFLGTAISGIASDKLGRAKLVFIVNVLLLMTTIICIIFMPVVPTDNKTHTNITCHEADEIRALIPCERIGEIMKVETCRSSCSEACVAKSNNDTCLELNLVLNSTISLRFNGTVLGKNSSVCEINVDSFIIDNSSYSWCSKEYHHCAVSCSLLDDKDSSNNGLVLIAYAALFMLFLTTFSNCYRCLDITTMFMVTEHDSSFGHERCFAMIGNVLMSPLAGYIADATTPTGGKRNYESALYFALAMNVLMLSFLHKLQVRAKPPSENMWRKTLGFLTKPEALSFFFIIFVLGTLWNFTRMFLFWYLEDMHANSMLIGLVVSVSALYGIPFLLTSHWWVKKIGTIPIFFLSFFAYALNTVLYSFLKNPWYSLVLESTGIFSYYLLWVAAMEYSHEIAPEGLSSTIIAVTGALHFSVGKLSSGLIAKFIMDSYGGRAAFRFSAILSISVAFLYGCYLLLWKRCTNDKCTFEEKENKQDLKNIEIYTVKLKD